MHGWRAGEAVPETADREGHAGDHGCVQAGFDATLGDFASGGVSGNGRWGSTRAEGTSEQQERGEWMDKWRYGQCGGERQERNSALTDRSNPGSSSPLEQQTSRCCGSQSETERCVANRSRHAVDVPKRDICQTRLGHVEIVDVLEDVWQSADLGVEDTPLRSGQRIGTRRNHERQTSGPLTPTEIQAEKKMTTGSTAKNATVESATRPKDDGIVVKD